ncbi:hypothetical protein NP233_g6921 [Leucocoprinus birnbaumii]|uniref:Uncharacterized protein n=1 Tax=Leucocoprinus birnbaumii TaxID=56174 RepID=A0AAD5VQ60_9AGAR|nr:hypothetical protein NP233_g6921 [Leucocoprinus birnbaumii]
MKLIPSESVIRAGSALIESILTFVRFITAYKETRAARSTVNEHIQHMKAFNPLLYVFYRDGTLFFYSSAGYAVAMKTDVISWSVSIPQTIVSFVFFNTNAWLIWLYVFYCQIATRLILNVRMANCDFNESLVSKPMGSIRFHHTTHHNSDGMYASGDAEELQEEHRD